MAMVLNTHGNYKLAMIWIGENVWIDNLSNIIIGKNVCVSQGAMLLSGNHNYKKTSFDLISKEILIDDGSWVGSKTKKIDMGAS